MTIARRMNWLVLAAALILTGCTPQNHPCPSAAPAVTATTAPALAGPHAWTTAPINDSQANFHFAIIPDRAGGTRPGVYESAIAKTNLLQPAFVMSVGDQIEGSDNPAEVDRMWDEFDGVLKRLTMRFYRLGGNHDLGNPALAAKWRQRYGSPYYSFRHQGVLFLVLDTEEPSFRINNAQLQWIQATLKQNADARWTMILMHKPIWDDPEAKPADRDNWQAVEALLADRPYTIFAGHQHTYKSADRDGHRYYILGTAGGATDTARQGCFDHILWVTMTAQGPLAAVLPLSGIQDGSK